MRSAGPPWRRTPTTGWSASSRGCTRSARRRCGSPGSTRCDKPLLHLHTQANVELPWADIDFDFMNLNQAAHGDREFGYIQTRLGVAAQDRRRPRLRPAGPRAGRGLAARRRRLGGVAVAEARALRRQHALRRGHRGRQDRGRAASSASRSTPGASTSWSPRSTPPPRADVDALVAEYVDPYDVAPELRRGRDRHQSLRDGAAIELGLRSFLEDGGFGAFTTNFEDLGGLKQLPGLAVQRLMAEGYGFGAEGDWKTAMLVRVANVMGAGLPGGASLMEDYTYDLTPGHERILGAHMLEVCPSLTTAEPAPGDPPARHRRQGGPGAPRLHRRPRARRRRRAVRHARPLPARRQRRRGRSRLPSRSPSFRSDARCGGRRRTSRRPRPPGSRPAPRTTRA